MDENKSCFWITCWGCDKTEKHPWNGPGEEHDAIMSDLKARGWRRHLFGPGADPWFCSEDCALYSYNARKAKEWWGNYFVNKSRNRRLKWLIIWSVIFTIGGWLLMTAMR